MARGRPYKSVIRDRIQQIVDALGVTYGYEIYKVYESVFSPIELRSMYYHLARGINLGEFETVGVKQERGKFTWGDISMRKYYILGPAATHKANDDLHIVIKTLNLHYRDLKNIVDWPGLLKEKLGYMQEEVNSFIRKKEKSKEAVAKLNKILDNYIDWFEKNNVKNIKQFEELKKRVERFLIG